MGTYRNCYKVAGFTRVSVKIVEVAKRTVNSSGSSDKVEPVPEVELDRGRLAGYREQRPVPVTKRVQRGYQIRPSLTHVQLQQCGAVGRRAGVRDGSGVGY